MGFAQGDRSYLFLTNEGKVLFGDEQLARCEVVAISDKVKQVAGSDFVFFAITETGKLFSWGRKNNGGSGSPQRIIKIKGRVIAGAVARNHRTALTDDGCVWTWGENFHGTLGDGTQKRKMVPSVVEGILGRSIQIAAGAGSSYALTEEGVIWSWGNNSYGQLGRGDIRTGVQSFVPGRVVSEKNFIKIAAGRYHCLGLTKEGEVYGWGEERVRTDWE